MAQYYQVLSQTDKSSVEELRQFYTTPIENQTVQYVINQDDHQQFQTQQILVPSDQVMVIENQGHIIVDPSAVTYQNSQYIVQDSSIDYQDQSQQVFYMKKDDNEQQITQPQPVLLNHQLSEPSNTLAPVESKTNSRQPSIHQMLQQPQQIQTSSPIRQILQTRTPIQQSSPQVVPQRNLLQQIRQPTLIQQPTHIQHQTHTAQHLSQISSMQTQADNRQAVALSDGRIMVLAEYKQLLAESKQQNSVPVANSIEDRMEVQNKFENAREQTQKQKTNRGGRRPRNVIPRSNSKNASLVYSNQDDTTSQHQYVEAHMKANQKQSLQQNQYVQQQQLLQQQACARQQQQALQHSQQPQPQYVIQPPSQHHQLTSCPLPSYVASSQIQQIIESTPISEEYSDSIRMLVLLENGEQRLITFTLPKEPCTIQEILEQVGVPFQSDTKIECTETNHAGINYLVTVGSHPYDNSLQEDIVTYGELNTQTNETSTVELIKLPSPEPQEIEAPRYVQGLLAVCDHCGYTSENFNRCTRCKYKLPEDAKTMPALNNNGKKMDAAKIQYNSVDKKLTLQKSTNGAAGNKSPNAFVKKKKSKLIEPEPVVLTVSSDDDEDEETTLNNKLSETDQLIKRLSNSAVTLSAIKKEPSASEIQQNVNQEVQISIAVKGGGKEDPIDNMDLSTTLLCRTIRIGSYRYIPNENLIIKSQGVILKVPSPKDPNEIKTIVIEKQHLVKVLVNFQKTLPVMFYYVKAAIGQTIREELGMVEGSDLYFDPLSIEEAYRRITILPEMINEETKIILKNIYGKPHNIMDELTTKEANDILIKTCPKELSKVISSSGYTEIKQLLIYPPGKGGLPINTEDYICLAQDQFLNDVIIDFYLKYLVLNLPREQQEKVHVFSTFFYKRLTTKPVKASRRSHPCEVDPALTAAQKRHARVEKWTKSVNLFEKDFIIIPINENCHWFLAIVCFPGLNGCVTIDGKPIQIEQKQKKKKDIK